MNAFNYLCFAIAAIGLLSVAIAWRVVNQNENVALEAAVKSATKAADDASTARRLTEENMKSMASMLERVRAGELMIEAVNKTDRKSVV